jgi:ABC-type sugar transport system substrate-binding protein
VDRLSIHVFLPDADNPYQQLQAQEARKSAARLGIAVEIASADGDFALQVRQIFRSTHAPDTDRPSALLVMPVQESALKSLSESTVAAGIGWVYLNRSAGNVQQLTQTNPAVPACLVSPDQKEIGRVHARQLRRLFPEGARILYVQGRLTTSSSEARASGLRDGLAEAGPRVEIVGTLDGNWTAKDAEAAVSRWFQLRMSAHLHVDAIVCQSDFMAVGALEGVRAAAVALANPALVRLPVLGCDGLPDCGRRLVDQGRLTATVIVPSSADKAIERLASFYRHGVALPPEVVLAPRGYPEDSRLDSRAREWARSAAG